MPSVKLRGVGAEVQLPEIKHVVTAHTLDADVTVTSSLVVLKEFSAGIYKFGDLIFIAGTVSFNKGATAGKTRLQYGSFGSGGGDVAFLTNDIPRQDIEHPAIQQRFISLSSIGQVVTPGEVIITVQADSDGSDSTANQFGTGFFLFGIQS